MLAKLVQEATFLSDGALSKHSHILCVLPYGKKLTGNIPGLLILQAQLKRRRSKPEELAKSAVSASLPHGGLISWIMLEPGKTVFDHQVSIRTALQPLLAENPSRLSIAVFGDENQRQSAAEIALYAAWVNGEKLSDRKKKKETVRLETISLHGYKKADGFVAVKACAEGNLLARELTILPPNELTPGLYRERIKKMAQTEKWTHREYDLKALRKMGAGAFVAVAQGSTEADAAIVQLSYKSKTAKKTIALVGKGICFDTGGHNLKPAKYMLGMHEDMNGSAVALGILVAAARMKLPVNIEVWLAIAQNHIGPNAYKQNDVVTALNGTTIEIIHTDAEGRMVLADTLTLAARQKPDLIIDFATLTGSMVAALGTRYSGVFSNQPELLERAVAAGKASGERVSYFPLNDDYDSALDSKIADVKQCTMDGGADHILAARFLQRFIDGIPWIHMDLSAASCEGGLGAVATNVTGFGVGWGAAMLGRL